MGKPPTAICGVDRHFFRAERSLQYGLRVGQLVDFLVQCRLVFPQPQQLRARQQRVHRAEGASVKFRLRHAVFSQALSDPGEHLDAAHILPEDDACQIITLPVHRRKGGLRAGDGYSRNSRRIDITLDDRTTHRVQRGSNELNGVLLRVAVRRIHGQHLPVILADHVSLHIEYDAAHAARSCVNRREILLHAYHLFALAITDSLRINPGRGAS